jgi:hypothetical protein
MKKMESKNKVTDEEKMKQEASEEENKYKPGFGK